MRRATIITLFLTLLFFSGCASSKSIKMEEYIGKKADCAIPVVDERSEKRLIIDYDGTSDVFDLFPAVQESLSYQICQRQAIKKYAENNKEFKVVIKDMNATLVPYSYESELTIVMIGHIQEGSKKGGIRSAVTRDITEVTESLVRDLVRDTISDFISKIETYVKQPVQ